MSQVNVVGSSLSTPLMDMLNADNIAPGTETSYQLCKEIYLYHPLGAKMVDHPVSIAQSLPRKIAVPDAPEDRVIEAFCREWKALDADSHIANTMTQGRIYGIGALAYGAVNVPTTDAIDPFDLAKLTLYFNVLDPLNTAGSLVLNQDPNAPDFQKVASVSVSGQPYHRSRVAVAMNEKPIYIAYTNSAFGYVGRSVFQRALFPLKSFIQSMITDDLVTLKSGLIVAKMKAPGSIVSNIMQQAMAWKRNLIKEGQTGNVLNIELTEEITTLDMNNVNTAMEVSRANILKNIATAADMPAVLLNSETFAEGFGEGTEDAKQVVRYIDGVRKHMQPLYDFFDKIVRHRAWSPAFYETIQADFPEYKNVPYETAFYQWSNCFEATWPSLLIEPESEKVKTDDVKLKAIIATLEVLLQELDPENKARLINWACDNINSNKTMFTNPLEFDRDDLLNYVPPAPPASESEPKPFSSEA